MMKVTSLTYTLTVNYTHLSLESCNKGWTGCQFHKLHLGHCNTQTTTQTWLKDKDQGQLIKWIKDVTYGTKMDSKPICK